MAPAAENGTVSLGGKTGCTIVLPGDASPVDSYAAQQLAGYLKQSTGTDFRVVSSEPAGNAGPAVFVGFSAPALARLGEPDALAELKDEEHVCRSKDGNVFLYGKGMHGQLWAVMLFLEELVGWRWYTPLEGPVVPSRPVITLEPFDLRRSFSFKFRQMQVLFDPDFYYQHGVNMGWMRKSRPAHFVSRIPYTAFTHTLPGYIPPTPDSRYADMFAWQDKKDYFETNPEFFTLDEHGKRVPDRQLCLSNPDLRAELTRNVFKDIAHAEGKGWRRMYVTLTAADTGGRFCCCPGCAALEEEYHTQGGPLIDYVIEVCGLLKEKRPGVMVKMAAYRRSQTQNPPVLPGDGMLPENLTVSFAPIEDQYFADWRNHRVPLIQDTVNDLFEWGRIAHSFMCWIYPSPYGTGIDMPVGMVERVTNNLRVMKDAGADSVFADHITILSRSNFAELQRYLMLKLMRDINCDTGAAIREFTDHHYGAAGAVMRTYLAELEQCRITMALPPGIGEGPGAVTYKSRTFDARTFPYLTVENLRRWQGYFDDMERLTAGQPKALLHVRAERRELDLATLWKWPAPGEQRPAYFYDYRVHVNRIRAVNAALHEENRWLRPVGENAIAEFMANIKDWQEGSRREAAE